MSGNSSGDKSEKPDVSRRCEARARVKRRRPRLIDATLTTGLVTSVFTVAFFFSYYQQLIEDAIESINQIAMQLSENSAPGQLMLTNVLVVLKFLVTLLPIPAAMMVASLILRRSDSQPAEPEDGPDGDAAAKDRQHVQE